MRMAPVRIRGAYPSRPKRTVCNRCLPLLLLRKSANFQLNRDCAQGGIVLPPETTHNATVIRLSPYTSQKE